MTDVSSTSSKRLEGPLLLPHLSNRTIYTSDQGTSSLSNAEKLKARAEELSVYLKSRGGNMVVVSETDLSSAERPPPSCGRITDLLGYLLLGGFVDYPARTPRKERHCRVPVCIDTTQRELKKWTS